jgi:hypothetical protein
MDIVERRKADISSICVFNNLMKFCLIFYPFFFRDPRHPPNQLNILFSMTYVFQHFPLFVVKPFHF